MATHLAERLLTIHNHLKQAIIEDELLLPSMPEVGLAIRELQSDPEASTKQLSQCIARDPGLASSVLRITNSPLLRGRVEIKDLDQAVSRLGFDYSADFALALSMKQLFFASSQQLDRQLEQTWQQSQKVAEVCHALALRLGTVPSGQAYLAGSLHLIGSLPILKYAEQDEQLSNNGLLLHQVLTKMQASLGCFLLKRWRFHPSMHEVPMACSQWHRLDSRPIADLVMVAKWLAQDPEHPLTELGWQQLPVVERLQLPDPDSGWLAELHQQARNPLS